MQALHQNSNINNTFYIPNFIHLYIDECTQYKFVRFFTSLQKNINETKP